MAFWINVILFAVCMIIQAIAFHRVAFGRAVFITVAMFFFTGLVFIAPNAPRFLVWFLYAVTWGYTLFMTVYAINRLRQRNK
ncbi:hypothetical protein OS242_18360 [Tumebacillus sp. DT12]|uniref:DUF2651 domain-containing protein n=1 Tax=Tumebacillus lacus TaxID=2995335 RepID=A0ABT3X4T4_9BACL|nr:hypothetical protein [Tumebacillus lacus]MCX7571910.1 hypothetical protein [Tumebacillus lacus]